ncbi:MAG: hypothetical protein AB2728_20885 [Candidatus Thiodiazotropha sp.]
MTCVLRSGSWINHPENARAANRNMNNPDNRNNNRDFCVVWSAHISPADVFILAIAQPGPVMGQSQVEPHLVEISVTGQQQPVTGCTLVFSGQKQPYLKI